MRRTGSGWTTEAQLVDRLSGPADRLAGHPEKRPMTSRSYVLFAACLGLMGALLSGCSASLDAHTYESTPMLPMTVTIVDTTTGESLWAMDVPVNQKLRVRFYDDRRPDDVVGNRTAMMRWELTSTDKSTGKLRNEIAVPQAHSRRIDVSLRDIPEYASTGAYAMSVTCHSFGLTGLSADHGLHPNECMCPGQCPLYPTTAPPASFDMPSRSGLTPTAEANN